MFSLKNTKSVLGCIGVATISSLAFIAAPAQAQPAYAGDGYAYSTNAPSVTVYAPRRFDRDSATGADIDVVQASRVVDTQDLDLSTNWGMHALNVRVDRAAREACNEIDRRYPDTVLDDNATCVSHAVDRAMGEVQDTLYDESR